jgi:hypothetical protein
MTKLSPVHYCEVLLSSPSYKTVSKVLLSRSTLIYTQTTSMGKPCGNYNLKDQILILYSIFFRYERKMRVQWDNSYLKTVFNWAGTKVFYSILPDLDRENEESKYRGED